MRPAALALLLLLGACAAGGGAAPLSAAGGRAIDFGTNAGEYANDGECDDPRFLGPGSSGGFGEYLMRDASDCREAYEANRVAMLSPVQLAAMEFTGVAEGVEFGDNSGQFANDGECDDPRFTGEGASMGFADEEMRDAADCRLAYRAGRVRLLTEADLAARNFTGSDGGIDFGDNSGDFAHDDECDDPRFAGLASSGGFEDHLMRDAADCHTAWEAGDVEYTGEPGFQDIADIVEAASADSGLDFGGDGGVFANDGECDDPRFTGEGLAGDGLESHVLNDATDCRAAFEAGRITLRSPDQLMDAGFFTGIYDGLDFGGNGGGYARDGECDDPRFAGPGTSSGAFQDHEYADATDCQAAYAEGRAWLKLHGVDPRDARYDGVSFGDNFGEFPDDGICDDPRFAGEGMGDTALVESDIGHDARDCLLAWLDGALTLKTE